MMFLLLNKTSFLQFQIVQSNAQTPTRIRAAVLGSTPPNQLLNKLEMLVGGELLKDTCTVRHNNLASGYMRKTYWSHSS